MKTFEVYNINGVQVEIDSDGEVFMNLENLNLSSDECVKKAEQIMNYMMTEGIIADGIIDSIKEEI